MTLGGLSRIVVATDGVRLHVTEHGDPNQPTVVLVHGYPDTSTVWDGVVAELAPRYHVVTYDVRGAGASDRPRRARAYRLGQLASDLRAVAGSVSPGRAVHVVAHDWGSIQSWEAMTESDARATFASFTSTSGPCLDHVGHLFRRITPRGIARTLGQLRRSWYVQTFQVPLLPYLAWRFGSAGRLFHGLQRREGVPQVAGYPAPTVRLDGATGARLYRANMAQRVLAPRARATSVPTQVIVPLRDAYASPHLTDGLERWTNDLWVRRVHSGHWLPLSNPRLLARAACELVDHVEGAPEPRTLRRQRVSAAERKSFADRLVLVTGAGSGIGRQTALCFAERGAEVVCVDLDGTRAARTATLAGLVGPAAHSYAVDVADADAMAELAKTVQAEHGSPDVVVNNAGIGLAGPFLETGVEDWQRILDVNLLGVVHGCRLFGAQMVERGEGGHLVNVASLAAFLPQRNLPAYSTTKAAVLMLSECVRGELAEHGIGVSAICPGIVKTGITSATRFVGLSDEEQTAKRRQITKSYARRNYGPEKVALAIVRAVEKDTPVVPVTPEAHIGAALARLSPSAARALAKVDLP